MERESTKEIGQRGRLSEDTPTLYMPLVQELGYDGMTEDGNRIL